MPCYADLVAALTLISGQEIAGHGISDEGMSEAPAARHEVRPTSDRDQAAQRCSVASMSRSLAAGRLEVGAVGGIALIIPTVGARLTYQLHPRLDVEASVEGVKWLLEDSADAYVFSQLQVRTPWRTDERSIRFFMAGVTVFAEYRQADEHRHTRPDGSVVVTPGYRRLDPAIPAVHGGIGWQWAIGRRAVVRTDVQVLLSPRSPIPLPRGTFGVAWVVGARQ
jgi:hypothetical protein